MERRYLYGGLLVVSGALLAVVQVIHGLQQSDVLAAQIVDVVPFSAAGLALAFTGYWLATQEAYEPDLQRVVLWGVGGALVFASVAALLLTSQQVALSDRLADPLNRASYVAIDNITIGALSGVLVGLYDAQSRRRMRELEEERDRVEEFAKKAADVNNYGRAINQATVVEEVTAYTIEGVETLTGFYETVFLEIVDDEIEIVGSTWVDVDDGTIEVLTEQALEQSQGETVIHSDDLPASLDAEVERVLSTLITRTDDKAAVLLSVSHLDETIEEEDRELLELLVQHSGTALENIYEQRVPAE